MGERIELDAFRGKLQLKAVKRRSGTHTAPQDLVASMWPLVAMQRLIFWPDAANCRDLREETRVILSTLTNHEAQVLRMRFGIDEPRHCSVREIAHHYSLECGHVLEIEAQALRKLRHPGGKPLRSVSRK